jgi:hypothetical protein
MPRSAKPNFSDSRPFSAVSRFACLKINLNRRSFFTYTTNQLYWNRTPSIPVSSTRPTHITSAPTSAPPQTHHGFRRNRLGHHQQPILLLQTQAARQRQQRPKVDQVHLLPQRAQRHRPLQPPVMPAGQLALCHHPLRPCHRPSVPLHQDHRTCAHAQ